MKTKCLLINPWVCDFSALNLWSRPLGLLRVAEYLSRYDVELSFIDCTDVYGNRRRFGTGKYPRRIIEKPEVLKQVPKNFARYGMSVNEFKDKLKKNLPCDIVFVTSIMSYWYPGVQQAIEIVKSMSPRTPVILGGIYATLYQSHAQENSGADHIFTGHIQEDIEEISEKFGCPLTGKKDPLPYYKLGLYRDMPFAPILTSAGCPYNCSYCASSVLNDRFVQQEPSVVINEIKELYGAGVRDFAFYDDALLVNAASHMKVILRGVIESGMKVRFHCPNGIHARFIDDELAGLMYKSGFMTLRISLETVNRERQLNTGGKITSDVFRSTIGNLKMQGFTKEQIGVYLMYGLPGQSLDEVDESVNFLKSLGVRINLNEFSPIPGTKNWDELISRGIITRDIDPLLTNNSVFAYLYSGYEADAIEKLKLDVKEYNSLGG
ncbi:MAG: B12-binding domain-containing radical SAM protein [Nitrospirota bacterium]